MTKSAEFQKELKEKIKPGVKASDLKKLKRSKSAGDIPKAPTSPALKIKQLEDQVKFHAETAANYLKSLQTSQAKVSELETQLKVRDKQNYEELERQKVINKTRNDCSLKKLETEKNKELEDLNNYCQELSEKYEELKTIKNWDIELQKELIKDEIIRENNQKLTELDNSLFKRHQNLKNWFTQYSQKKKLDQELQENIEEASNELVAQDKVIEKLRTENNRLQKTNQSLQKDFQLASRLAESRKVPYYSPEDKGTYWEYTLYALVVVCFISLLNSSWKNRKYE